MVPTDTSDRGTSMGDNSVRLTRSSGAGGRSSWSATDAERGREHPRNILIAVPDLARDPGLLHYTDALGVGVVGQASRAVSRGTLDSSVPQVAKSSRFARRFITGLRSWTRPNVSKPALPRKSLRAVCARTAAASAAATGQQRAHTRRTAHRTHRGRPPCAAASSSAADTTHERRRTTTKRCCYGVPKRTQSRR